MLALYLHSIIICLFCMVMIISAMAYYMFKDLKAMGRIIPKEIPTVSQAIKAILSLLVVCSIPIVNIITIADIVARKEFYYSSVWEQLKDKFY